MRIGIITPRYPPVVEGGGEISVKLLADRLSSQGDTVIVYSFDGGTQQQVDGVTVRRLRNASSGILEIANCYAAYGLRQYYTELKSLDVIHAYNVSLTPVTGYLSQKLAIPSVATLNSYDLLPKSTFGVTADLPRRLYELLAMPTTGRLLRRKVLNVSRFVTLSEASKHIYSENGFGRKPIDVVPNMIDTSFSIPDLKKDSSRYSLLYVGSLIKEKGVEFLIRAMDHLPPDISLSIVGSGDRRQYLETVAAKLNISDRITFIGHVPYAEVRRQYATADCFVHPGVWPEPFGRTILEAMQAGLPVVTTDIGGPAEVVPQTELRCTPRDPEALATAIRTARNQPDIGAKNKSFVTQRFSPDVVLERLYEVYERAIDSH